MTSPEPLALAARIEQAGGRKTVRPVLKQSIEHCPGAYSLHLYCKYENPAHGLHEFPHEPEHCQTYGEAASYARSYGWVLHRDATATCPKCAQALGLRRALASTESRP